MQDGELRYNTIAEQLNKERIIVFIIAEQLNKERAVPCARGRKFV